MSLSLYVFLLAYCVVAYGHSVLPFVSAIPFVVGVPFLSGARYLHEHTINTRHGE